MSNESDVVHSDDTKEFESKALTDDVVHANTEKRFESMLTTVDNPFDPFTQFKPWYSYDLASGYHTLALLARIINSSPELSEADELLANESAIDEIIKENVSGMHRRLTREVEQAS
jgi:hypothetical protein